MDNISHDFVGHPLIHTHHYGRFFPTTYLGPHRVSLILEKLTCQSPMKCKGKNLIWEDGSPHGRSTRMKRRRRHPQVIGWMWLMSKELGGYWQIYDTGQQEAWLRWLLLKDFGHHLQNYDTGQQEAWLRWFGHHLANTLPKGRRVEKRWLDTCIIEQHRVWMHGVDVLLISFIMSSSHELYDGSMGRQQNVLLLCLFLGEQGQSFSHTLHDVAGRGDGIISSVFDDLGALLSWGVFHICCSIIGGVFDKEHVKEQSFVLTGAYLHELTALSFGSRTLWMKCAQQRYGGSITHRSQDHFIFAPDEQRGGNDGRDIYGISFLTWISKHQEDYLFAAHRSVFFIVCQHTMKDSCMDPCTILLPAYGEEFVFTFIDLHTLAIPMQYFSS